MTCLLALLGCDGSGDGGSRGGSGAMPGSGGGDGDGSGAMQTAGDGDGDAAGDGDGDGDAIGDGDGDGDGGGDPNAVMPGNLCDRMATIQCEGEQRCCDAPGRDFDTCKATMKQGCIAELYLDSMSANPVTGFDAGRAQIAFTEYDTRAQACDTSVASWGLTESGLRGILAGTVTAGGKCEPDNLNDRASVAAALASCTGGATHACLPTTLPIPMWRCDPRTGDGGKCFSDANCNDGLFCDNPDFMNLNAKCQPRLADGESCNTPNECASLMCKSGKCVPATQQAVYCLDNG